MATNGRRWIHGSLAVLQSAAAIALAPIDAVLDADRFGWHIHVETPERTHCPVHYGQAFGQVVRSLCADGAMPAPIGEPPLASVEWVHESPAGSEAPCPQRSLFKGGMPRAPPTT